MGDAILSLHCTSSWMATHTVLCQGDFTLILVVFLSLRETFGRKRVVALFAQKHGEQGRVPGTSRPPLTLAGAAMGLPMGQQGGPVGARPSAGMCCSWGDFLRISVSSGASSAKGGCPLVSVKSIHRSNRAVTGPPTASVCACENRVKVQGTKSS